MHFFFLFNGLTHLVKKVHRHGARGSYHRSHPAPVRQSTLVGVQSTFAIGQNSTSSTKGTNAGVGADNILQKKQVKVEPLPKRSEPQLLRWVLDNGFVA